VAEKAKFRVTHRSKFGELCRAFNAHIDLLVVVVSHHQGGWLFDGQGAGEREGDGAQVAIAANRPRGPVLKHHRLPFWQTDD
jgi:hypothetical protein